MEKTIIALVGMSGSGKDLIASHLEYHLSIPRLVSYTTRPRRANETDGVEHYFVDNEFFETQSNFLAYALFGGEHYWTRLDQIPDGACTYNIDEKALLEMRKKFGDQYRIFAVLVKRPGIDEKKIGKERMKRDADRTILPDDYYDAIINNDSTITKVLLEAEEKIMNLLK